jgi:hypothetical protein
VNLLIALLDRRNKTNNTPFVFLAEVRIKSFLRNSELVYCFVFLSVVVVPEISSGKRQQDGLWFLKSIQEDEQRDKLRQTTRTYVFPITINQTVYVSTAMKT